MGDWADLITAVTLLLTALGTGAYRLYRDRNAAREAAIEAARDAAVAQARLEARTEQAEATVTQLKAEIANKDAAMAECTTARTELRQLLIACQRGL